MTYWSNDKRSLAEKYGDEFVDESHAKSLIGWWYTQLVVSDRYDEFTANRISGPEWRVITELFIIASQILEE